MGQCSGCKEYYNPCEITLYEYNLSQSSYSKNFKNPFFPGESYNNEIFNAKNQQKMLNEILVQENNDEEEENILKEQQRLKEEFELKQKLIKEEEDKRNEELNQLKNQVLQEEKDNRMNSNSLSQLSNINNKNNNININDKQSENNEISEINSKEIEENIKINKTLENMCILGNIAKKEIKEEKEKNPEKFIETSEALKLEETDEGLFALGLLSQNLEGIGIETAIEKNSEEDENDAAATCLQFIANGLAKKKKYDLHFEFGKERNEELLNNKEEYESFKKDLKKKLSKDYHISEDKIIITFPQRGSFHVQVIFQSEEFNDLNLEEFKEKFKNDEEFKELSNLKEIHSDVIMGACKLSKNQLDERGNNFDGWAIGEKRGGKPYNSPVGWIGIGLKVLDKYNNNNWIGCNGDPDEWCVAYHGVGRDKPSDNVKKITGLIYKGAFKPGENQVHRDCENLNKPGTKVGDGVYCTPNVDTAAGYSGISEINGKSYMTVLMVRVKPSAIRECSDGGDYWVVNGTTDEIRPYRILYKCL